jgi:hypothetical protein
LPGNASRSNEHAGQTDAHSNDKRFHCVLPGLFTLNNTRNIDFYRGEIQQWGNKNFEREEKGEDGIKTKTKIWKGLCPLDPAGKMLILYRPSNLPSRGGLFTSF